MLDIMSLVVLTYVMGAILAAVTIIYAAVHTRNKDRVGYPERVRTLAELISGCVTLFIIAATLSLLINLGVIQ